MRSDLIDPTIAVHNGRVVKRTGDGILVEFHSVVDAVRCAIEVQNGMVERNAVFRPSAASSSASVSTSRVVEESDGDFMGDGVNIAARLEGIAEPGAICLSEQAYWQVKSRARSCCERSGRDQILRTLLNRSGVHSLEVGRPVQAKPAAALPETSASSSAPRLSIVVLPFANFGGDPEQEYSSMVSPKVLRRICRGSPVRS